MKTPRRLQIVGPALIVCLALYVISNLLIRFSKPNSSTYFVLAGYVLAAAYAVRFARRSEESRRILIRFIGFYILIRSPLVLIPLRDYPRTALTALLIIEGPWLLVLGILLATTPPDPAKDQAKNPSVVAAIWIGFVALAFLLFFGPRCYQYFQAKGSVVPMGINNAQPVVPH